MDNMDQQLFTKWEVSGTQPDKLQEHTDQIKKHLSNTAESIIQIGNHLIEVKDIIPHGLYEEWLENEFNWSKRQANRYINVAKAFKSDKLADLNINKTALYRLARPSTNRELREDCIEIAKTQGSLSTSDIDNIEKDRKQRKSDGPFKSQFNKDLEADKKDEALKKFNVDDNDKSEIDIEGKAQFLKANTEHDIEYYHDIKNEFKQKLDHLSWIAKQKRASIYNGIKSQDEMEYLQESVRKGIKELQQLDEVLTNCSADGTMLEINL